MKNLGPNTNTYKNQKFVPSGEVRAQPSNQCEADNT